MKSRLAGISFYNLPDFPNRWRVMRYGIGFLVLHKTYPMQTNEELIEVLNDLIKINNDRINGYEKACDEIKATDADLQAMFQKMANDSRDHARELSNEVVKLGGEPATDTTVSGKIYRTWMDVKAAFARKERLSVLEACEFGEDAAQRAYEAALASDAEINAETRQLIMDQKASLKASHDIIKKYRDLHEAVAS
ncbi:MAG: hypothetical protein JWQ78_885 [Sediminibacterium sp.]|nr:hypothetical protein [Sediminibacterium sp.]